MKVTPAIVLSALTIAASSPTISAAPFPGGSGSGSTRHASGSGQYLETGEGTPQLRSPEPDATLSPRARGVDRFGGAGGSPLVPRRASAKYDSKREQASSGNGHSHERRQLPGLGGLGLGLPPLPLNGLGLDPSALAGQATSQLSGLGLGNLGAGAGGLGLGGLTNTVSGLQGQLGGLAGATGGQGLGLGLLNGLPVAGPLVGQVSQAAGLQNLLGGAQGQGQGLGLGGLTGQVNGLLGGLEGPLGTTLNTVQGTVNGLEGQLGSTLNTVQGTVGGLTAGTPLAGLSGTLGGLTSSLGLANLQQALSAQATQIQQLQQLLQSVNVPFPDAAKAPSAAKAAVPDPSLSGAANAANDGLNAANDATTQAANLAAAQYAQAIQALGGLLPNNASGQQLPSVTGAIPSGAGGAFVGANQALTPAFQAGGQALTAASNALNNAGALPFGQQLAQQVQGITNPVQAGLPPALSDLINQLQGAASGAPGIALPPLGAASTNDLLAQWQQQAAGYSTAAQQQLQSLGLFTPNTGKVLAAVPGSSSADAASLTPAGVARTAFDAPIAGTALDATDNAPAVPAVAPLADAQVAADGQVAMATEAVAAEASTLSSWAPEPTAPGSATTTGVAPSSAFNAMTYLAPPLTADPTREAGPTDVAFYTSNVAAPATATSTSSAAAPPASSVAAPEAPAPSDQPQPQPVQKRDSLLSAPAQPQALPVGDDALGNYVSEQSQDSHLQPLAPNVAPYLQQYAYADAPLPLPQPSSISPAASFVSAWSTTPLPSAALQSLPTPPSAASDPLPTFVADQIPAVKAVSGKRPAPTPYSGWSQDTKYNENSNGQASSAADATPQDGSAASSSAPAPSSGPSVEGVAPPPIPLRNRNRLLRQRRQLDLQPESSPSSTAKANKDDTVFDGVGNIRLDPHKQAGDAGSSSSGHTGGVPHPPSNWSQDTVYSDGSSTGSRVANAGSPPAPAAPLHNANSPAKALLGQRDVADGEQPSEALPPATKAGRPAMLRQRAFDRQNPDHVHSGKDHNKKEPCRDPKHHHHTKKPPAASVSPAATEPDAVEAAPERLRLTRMVRFKRAAKQGEDGDESNGTGGAEDDDYHPTGPPPPAKNMHTPPAGEHGMSGPFPPNADALTPKAPKSRSKASNAEVTDDDETAAEEEADAPAPKPKSKPSKDSEGAKKGKKDGKKASSTKKGKDGKKKSSPKTAKASEADEEAEEEPAEPKETSVEKLKRRFAQARKAFRSSR